MRELQLWTETLVVLVVVMCIVAISWSFKQRKETFLEDRNPSIADNKGASGIDYEIFHSIVNSYRTILDRPPSEAEVQMQLGRLSHDKVYTVMKMDQSLRQSAEYRRLVALQKNTVHADFEGVVSDRQTIEIVKARYMKIAGHEPDETTLKFLLEKYRKSQLDDVYLQALIENVTMTPMAASGYVGPTGPGSPKTGSGSRNGASDSVSNSIDRTSDSDAAERLYSILGLDEATVKAILAGDDAVTRKALEAARLERQKDGCAISQRCSLTKNMTPDQVADYVKDGAQRDMKIQACNYAKVQRAQELANAGLKPGRPVGSWTMPEQSRTPVCIGGKSDPVALNSQTALLGTLLEDQQPKHPDMVLL